MVRFAVTSDLHYGGDGTCRPEKQRDVQGIMHLARTRAIDFVVVTGDLTVTGMDGRATFLARLGIPIKFPGVPDELGAYRRQFVDPLSALGTPVMSLVGNHDVEYNREMVRWWIQSKHGAGRGGAPPDCYEIRTAAGDGALFACLGLYPDAAALRWLQSKVAQRGAHVPVVLFWHYNTVGELSDWWSMEEKYAAAAAFRHMNVRAAFVGHLHVCAPGQHALHADPVLGVPVYNTAGHAYARAHLHGGQVSVEWL